MKRVLWTLVLLPTFLLLASCGATGPSPVITINPSGASLNVNTTQQFTATIQNLSSTLVNWEVNGTVGGNATNGTITTGGLYTAPATLPGTNLNVVTVTAVAQAQTSLTAVADVTILPAAAIVISPTSATVAAGGQFSFLASVGSSAQNTGVNWEVNGIINGNSTIGQIAGGLYIAPLIPPAGGVVTVTAVEANDATQTASATVTVTLGTPTISGAYTFSVTGTTASGAPFSRTGVFYTGINGTITNGTEDVNVLGAPLAPTQFSGLYSIGPDGRGTMQLCEGSAANCTPGQVTSNYRIIVPSPNQFQIIPFDTGTAGIGEAISQSNLQFGAIDLSGCFTFDFSGTSSTPSTPESILGYFCSNGSGGIVPAGVSTKTGELDINVGGAVTNVALTNSTYTLGGNNRGTLTLIPSVGTPIHLAFYMVTPNRAKFAAIDASLVVSGDANTQSTPVPSLWTNATLNAPIVFKLSGTGSSGGIADVGRFLPDGNGNIQTGSTLDENYSGNVTNPSVQGTYSIDSFGRGTLNLSNGNTYIFYMISQNNAVLQQFATGLVSHGILVPQTGGPFTSATFNGSFGLILNGQIVGPNAKEDIVGQLSVSPAANGVGGSMAGTLDVNDSTLGPLKLGEVNVGTYTSISGTTGRGTMNLNPSADNRNFAIYFVSPTQLYVLGTDSTRLAVGSVNKQF